MCIGDWRLGRLIRAVEGPIVTFGVGLLTINPSMQRVGLTFALAGTGTTVAPLATVSVNGLAFMSLDNGFPYVHFTMATHGDLVTKQWGFQVIGATAYGYYIEYFLPENYLSAALKSFESEYNL